MRGLLQPGKCWHDDELIEEERLRLRDVAAICGGSFYFFFFFCCRLLLLAVNRSTTMRLIKLIDFDDDVGLGVTALPTADKTDRLLRLSYNTQSGDSRPRCSASRS